MRNLIIDQIGKAMVPLLIELALDNFDDLYLFMEEQALKTTNRLDDMAVRFLMDWLQDWLTEQSEGK